MNKKPNIIFILTDDQGAWAMNCAGNSEIHTPNLDALAQSGMRFENFFCASPVCSPARASIFTGKIPSQHGVHDWIKSGNIDKSELGEHSNIECFKYEDKKIPYIDGMTTYTDILEKNGYTCALSGKWHLGDSLNPQHGFSKWFTIARGGCTYYNSDMVENNSIYFESKYITDVITDKALQFIDEFNSIENFNEIDRINKKEKPFYLSVHYTAPHSPWSYNNHPKEYWDIYNNCEFNSTPDCPIHTWQLQTAPHGTGEKRKELLQGYYTAITAMDFNIGRIIQKLKESGILDNTIIIFTSDNGMNMGHHGIWGKGNGTFPFNMYDTAVKVPFIISYPNKINAGVVSENIHSHYDIIHTLIDYLGINEPLSDNLPGKSFAEVLRGNTNDNSGHIVVFDEYGPVRMIRNNEWKYICRYPYGPDELYHLTLDPNENENLINNSEFNSIKQEMKHKLTDWFLQYVDPKVDGTKEAVTGYGQLRKAGIYSEGKNTYDKN